VNFNREVLGEEAGRFFGDAAELAAQVEAAEADPGAAADRGDAARKRAAERYVWDDVAASYERLCEDLVAGRRTRKTIRGK
jgi:glycosyltransferase involved in cell wall biosynthesis